MQQRNDQSAQKVNPPEPPPGFSPEAFFADISPWHQRWEIFKNVFTPGRNPVELLCEISELPGDLSGKRVLDVGAWHGCFSFECERRGAKEIVALSLEDPGASGFLKLKQLLHSKVEYLRGSVYTLSPEKLGTFDVILFFGVLYHLRYPLLAIDRLRSVSTGEVFIETHIIDNSLWWRKSLHSHIGRIPFFRSLWRETPIWRYYRESELTPGDQSNWFGPNIIAVLEAFQSAGFEITFTRSWGDRAAFRAKATPLPARLIQFTYESAEENREVLGLSG